MRHANRNGMRALFGWHALRYSEGVGVAPRPSEYLRACHPCLRYGLTRKQNMALRYPVLVLLLFTAPARLTAQQADLNDMAEQAMKEAAHKVAPSVVQILTQGGAEQVVVGAKGLTFRKAVGPTTGTISRTPVNNAKKTACLMPRITPRPI